MSLPKSVFPFVKVVVSGHVVEVWRFLEMPVPSDSGGKVSERTDSDRLEDRQKNQRRSRWTFMRLVNMNFDTDSKFITFTFRDGVLNDVTDVREANRYWNKFMSKMRRKFGKFKWAVVVEFQDTNGRGAVHFHMIADLPYIPQSELEEIWGAGFVWVNRIEHVDNVGAYVSKYMTEDLADERLRGLKAWRVSRDMKKPLVLRGVEARDFLDGLAVEDRPVVMSVEYGSDYHGLIQYEQYNLSRSLVHT